MKNLMILLTFLIVACASPSETVQNESSTEATESATTMDPQQMAEIDRSTLEAQIFSVEQEIAELEAKISSHQKISNRPTAKLPALTHEELKSFETQKASLEARKKELESQMSALQ